MQHSPTERERELDRRFSYHPPTGPVIQAHIQMRKMTRQIAEEIQLYVPPGREHALAMTKIEEALLWANAGIARAASKPARRDDGILLLSPLPAAE